MPLAHHLESKPPEKINSGRQLLTVRGKSGNRGEVLNQLLTFQLHRSWIAFSSITILFNKYILDNAGFRKSPLVSSCHNNLNLTTLQTSVRPLASPSSCRMLIYSSWYFNMLASRCCNALDPSLGQDNHSPRWPQNSQDDWPSLPSGHHAHWYPLQSQPCLQQCDISISQRRVYPDA
jgi:hypothetical protein